MSTPTDSSSPIATSPYPPQHLQRRKGNNPNGSFESSSIISELSIEQDESHLRSVNNEQLSRPSSQEKRDDWWISDHNHNHNHHHDRSASSSTAGFNRSHISNTRSTLSQDRYNSTIDNSMETDPDPDHHHHHHQSSRHERRRRDIFEEHIDMSCENADNNHSTVEFNVLRKFSSLDIHRKQGESSKNTSFQSTFGSSIFPKTRSAQFRSGSSTVPMERYPSSDTDTAQHQTPNDRYTSRNHQSPNFTAKSHKSSITIIEHQTREVHASLEESDISDSISAHTSQSHKTSSSLISPSNSFPNTMSSCNLTQEISTGSASFNSFNGWIEPEESPGTQNQGNSSDQQSQNSFPYRIEQETHTFKDNEPLTLDDSTQPYVQNTGEEDVPYLQQVIQSNLDDDTQPYVPKRNEESSLYPFQIVQSSPDDSTQPYVPYNNEHDISYIHQVIQSTSEDDTQSYIQNYNEDTQSIPDKSTQPYQVHHEEQEVSYLQQAIQSIPEDDAVYSSNETNERSLAQENPPSSQENSDPNTSVSQISSQKASFGSSGGSFPYIDNSEHEQIQPPIISEAPIPAITKENNVNGLELEYQEKADSTTKEPTQTYDPASLHTRRHKETQRVNKRAQYSQSSQDSNKSESERAVPNDKPPYTIHTSEPFFLNPVPETPAQTLFYTTKVLTIIPEHTHCIQSSFSLGTCWENEDYTTLAVNRSSSCKYVDPCKLSCAILGFPGTKSLPERECSRDYPCSIGRKRRLGEERGGTNGYANKRIHTPRSVLEIETHLGRIRADYLDTSDTSGDEDNLNIECNSTQTLDQSIQEEFLDVYGSCTNTQVLQDPRRLLESESRRVVLAENTQEEEEEKEKEKEQQEQEHGQEEQEEVGVEGKFSDSFLGNTDWIDSGSSLSNGPSQSTQETLDDQESPSRQESRYNQNNQNSQNTQYFTTVPNCNLFQNSQSQQTQGSQRSVALSTSSQRSHNSSSTPGIEYRVTKPISSRESSQNMTCRETLSQSPKKPIDRVKSQINSRFFSQKPVNVPFDLRNHAHIESTGELDYTTKERNPLSNRAFPRRPGIGLSRAPSSQTQTSQKGLNTFYNQVLPTTVREGTKRKNYGMRSHRGLDRLGENDS
ncbi:hypothetical protein CLU79DRAFT_840174 [Phycomyces nitens]|nr:hypothetical protein CLU79DRAFT_840174 [Phycomyces nitens]